VAQDTVVVVFSSGEPNVCAAPKRPQSGRAGAHRALDGDGGTVDVCRSSTAAASAPSAMAGAWQRFRTATGQRWNVLPAPRPPAVASIYVVTLEGEEFCVYPPDGKVRWCARSIFTGTLQ
jgi:hypothetical protein